MMEKLPETPFEIADLVDPVNPEPEDEIYSNNIPIRTWSRGKTLNDFLLEDEDGEMEESYSIEGDLAHYFPQAKGADDEDGNADIDGEDIKEDPEVLPADQATTQKVSNAFGVTTKYDDDFDTDDSVSESSDEDGADDDYQGEDEPDEVEDENADQLTGRKTGDTIKDGASRGSVPSVESVANDETIQNILNDNHLHVSEELRDIIEQYDAAISAAKLSYNSPVINIDSLHPDLSNADSQKPKNGEGSYPKEQAASLDQPMLDMSIFSDDESKDSDCDKYYGDYEDDEYNDGLDQEFRLSPGQKRRKPANHLTDQSADSNSRAQASKVSKAGIFNGKKVKASGYGPVDAQKRRQERVWRERQKNFDAKSKIKEALMEIALKRKYEEESSQLQQQREEARKRKFKETIPKKKPENAMNEDVLKEEEERKEKIAATRRKFKEKHRMILENLMKKNKEIGKKVEEEELLNLKKKEKYHKKILKMIRAAEDFKANEEYLDNSSMTEEPSLSHPKAEKISKPMDRSVRETETRTAKQSKHIDQHESMREYAIRSDERYEKRRESTTAPVQGSKIEDISPRNTRRAAGSALAAIRCNRTSIQGIPSSDIATSVPSYEEFTENEEEKQQMAKKRYLNAKAAQEKMSVYLNSLAEQKRKEEDEKRKKEERKRKRAQLLSIRVMAEAAERKAMEAEDLLRSQTIPTTKANNQPIPATNTSKGSNQGLGEKVTVKEGKTVIAASKASYNEKNIKSNEDNAKPSTEETRSVPPSNRIPEKHVASNKAIENTPSNDNPVNSSVQPAPKLTQEMAEALVQRLTKPMTKPSLTTTITNPAGEETVISMVPFRDYNDWKRKNNVNSDSQVFCMTGWYPCVKEALIARGWAYNADPNSPFCDMKWTLKSIDVNQESLQPWQLTNHFCKNMAITTKAGLLRSLQPLMWMVDVASSDIYPRGYDLTISDDMQAFIDDFRCQKAAANLKKVFEDVSGLKKCPQRPLTSPSTSTSPHRRVSIVSEPPPAVIDVDHYHVNKVVFEMSCKVLERSLRPFDDVCLDQQDESLDLEYAITPLEWEIIVGNDINGKGSLPDDPMEPVDSFIASTGNNEEIATSVGTLSHSNSKNLQISPMSTTNIAATSRKLLKIDSKRSRETTMQSIQELVPLSMKGYQRVAKILSVLATVEGNQAGLNGWGRNAKNLWIVKPAAKSRGRGITTFNDLQKLLKYVEAGSGHASQWVVQKYMENPLIIAKRKFDLRQWVLVTDWNPLTIYFYDEFYARFSVDEYNTSETTLDNSYIHLVNNSIGKNSENFNKIVQTEFGVDLEGYMMSHSQFKDHIQRLSGEDLVETKIKPRMKDIAKWSLMSASEMIEHRKNSWELYGFDFMIDEDFNPWLIEINSSPACDYSTSVTEVYVKKALVEILNVVLDLKKWESTAKKTRTGERPDTGGWERIYKGPLFEKPVAALGTDMLIKGEGCKLPRTTGNPLNPIPSSYNRSYSQSGIPRRVGKKLAIDSTTMAAASSNSPSNLSICTIKSPQNHSREEATSSSVSGIASIDDEGESGLGIVGSGVSKANSHHKPVPPSQAKGAAMSFNRNDGNSDEANIDLRASYPAKLVPDNPITMKSHTMSDDRSLDQEVREQETIQRSKLHVNLPQSPTAVNGHGDNSMMDDSVLDDSCDDLPELRSVSNRSSVIQPTNRPEISPSSAKETVKSNLSITPNSSKLQKSKYFPGNVAAAIPVKVFQVEF